MNNAELLLLSRLTNALRRLGAKLDTAQFAVDDDYARRSLEDASKIADSDIRSIAQQLSLLRSLSRNAPPGHTDQSAATEKVEEESGEAGAPRYVKSIR